MANDPPSAPDRGRTARRPDQIPCSGWTDIALRVRHASVQGNLSVVAAGVTFFVLLSVVPGMAAVVAVFGVVVDPAFVSRHVDAFGYALPGDVQRLLEQQLVRLATPSSQALGAGTLGGVLAIWSATRAARALIAALNIAYREPETRGFVRLNLTAMGLALGLLVVVVVELATATVIPAVLPMLGLSDPGASAIALLRWPALMGFLMLALAAMYRYAPDRAMARWSWTGPGALLSATLWLLGSIALSLLVSGSARYEAVYGSLGAAVVLMLWIYVAAYSVLLGALVNAEAERQTTWDTTSGVPQPLGQRNAHAADTVGQAADAGGVGQRF